MRKLKLAALLFLVVPVLPAQQPLSNESVVKMVKAGLSADIVAATVNSQAGHYNLSPEGLIALKQAGASDKVISAMIAHNSSAAPSTASGPTSFGSLGGTDTASPNGLPPGVDSVGFYYKDKDGNWTEVNAEVVNFKTGGALKHIGSAGIVKGDLNGHVAGFHSRLALQPPASFILYAPEGVSPGEYQLIRFRSNSDSREFRSLTGGVAHTSGGADRDTAEFTSKKLAPHVYEITLNTDIGKGEYGFLPPLESAGGKNISSSGKIYTFSFAQ
jgi:hypothetical protein